MNKYKKLNVIKKKRIRGEIKKNHSLLAFAIEPNGEFCSLEEINKEVHKIRKNNEGKYNI
jgi:hypothetical protein